jgi:hypothetical protein
MAKSATPSGARASRIAFMTVGVAATVPPSAIPAMGKEDPSLTEFDAALARD